MGAMIEGRSSSVHIDGSQIVDRESFHDTCAKAFGFPDFYGRNSNAWIDCVSYIDSPEAGMTRLTIGRTDFLDIELTNVVALAERCPDILAELALLIACVNQRFVESGDRPPLRLVLL